MLLQFGHTPCAAPGTAREQPLQQTWFAALCRATRPAAGAASVSAVVATSIFASAKKTFTGRQSDRRNAHLFAFRIPAVLFDSDSFAFRHTHRRATLT